MARRRRPQSTLFWENFTRSYQVRAVALLMAVAMVTVSCGREAGVARSLAEVNYGDGARTAAKPGKPRSLTPAERLAATASELRELLTKQSRADLRKSDAARLAGLRARLSSQVRVIESRFAVDRAKLKELGARAALDRLAKIERTTATVRRVTFAALAALPPNGAEDDAAAKKAILALNSLAPEAPQQPLSSELPYRASDAKPQPVSLGAGIAPAYATPTPDTPASSLPREPEPADTAAAPEGAISPAITAKAAALGHDPVRIYEYVRNQIRFEPYQGVRKGAEQTLTELAGNDSDQAALAIALLRASNTPARYVRGVAALPIERAANWLGLDTAAGDKLQAVRAILTASGIPFGSVYTGGELSHVRFLHTWIEAYVPRDAYRGVDEGIGGKGWLPLDPSIKQHTFTRPAADMKALLSPDAESFATGYAEGLEVVGENDGLIAPPDADTTTALTTLAEQATAKLRAAGIDDNSTVSDLIGSATIVRSESGLLPSSLPFRQEQVQAEWRATPDSQLARVSIRVAGGDPYASDPIDIWDDGSTDDGSISFTAPTYELANKRVTLAYAPASQIDQEVIDAYHGLLDAPAYAASLIPVLRAEGAVVAQGRTPVSTGYAQKMTITYTNPGFAPSTIENTAYVGAISAIALDLGRASADQLKVRATALKSLADTTTTDNVLTDARAGEMLYELGRLYFLRNDSFNAVTSQAMGVHQQRQLSGAVTATDLTVSYVSSFPVSVSLTGMNIDVDEDFQSVVPKHDNRQTAQSYIRSTGMNASASEGLIFERTVGGEAASTAKVLQVATAQRIPIYGIDSTNIDRVLPELAIAPAVRDEIQRAVSYGRTVTIPKTQVSVGSWTGSGYIIADSGGSAAYRISGGISGGSTGITIQGIGGALDKITPDVVDKCSWAAGLISGVGVAGLLKFLSVLIVHMLAGYSFFGMPAWLFLTNGVFFTALSLMFLALLAWDILEEC